MVERLDQTKHESKLMFSLVKSLVWLKQTWGVIIRTCLISLSDLRVWLTVDCTAGRILEKDLLKSK